MESVERLTQAYTQAPWRRQLQLIGLFLLALILIALVAGIYLSVTARSATVGREVQVMYREMETIRRENEDLDTQLALLTSNEVMEQRAKDLGFHPVDPSNLVYLLVPGYMEPRPPDLAQKPGLNLEQKTELPSDYTESLFDWLRQRVFEPAAPLMEDIP
jgi:cell division protein FtsL